MEKNLLTMKGLEYLVNASIMTVIWGVMPLIALTDYYFFKASIIQDVWWSILYLFFYGIGAILFIIGLYRMWQGRDEFGKEHKINLGKTLWLIILLLAITTFISGPATMIIQANITMMVSFFLRNTLTTTASKGDFMLLKPKSIFALVKSALAFS